MNECGLNQNCKSMSIFVGIRDYFQVKEEKSRIGPILLGFVMFVVIGSGATDLKCAWVPDLFR
jgi:hypothetical protein